MVKQSDREDSFSFLAEVIEKMIDSQIGHAESLSSIKNSNIEISSGIKSILGHFTNGFRSELKKHIDEQIEWHHNEVTNMLHAKNEDLINSIDCLSQKIQSVNESNNKLIQKTEDLQNIIKSPGLWLKLFVGFIVALGSISAGLLTLDKIIEANASKQMQQKTIKEPNVVYPYESASVKEK